MSDSVILSRSEKSMYSCSLTVQSLALLTRTYLSSAVRNHKNGGRSAGRRIPRALLRIKAVGESLPLKKRRRDLSRTDGAGATRTVCLRRTDSLRAARTGMRYAVRAHAEFSSRPHRFAVCRPGACRVSLAPEPVCSGRTDSPRASCTGL